MELIDRFIRSGADLVEPFRRASAEDLKKRAWHYLGTITIGAFVGFPAHELALADELARSGHRALGTGLDAR